MAQVDDPVAGPTEHAHALSLQSRIVLGEAISWRAVELDMDALTPDMIQKDEIHGLLPAGLDAGVHGEAGASDP